ncbi:hypothetical protein BDV97DRAFT_401690 [Delphinella strobiligena]|nr:hypothetical protein BDV97DRAFT_401690 [Delphinella strobiligena]
MSEHDTDDSEPQKPMQKCCFPATNFLRQRNHALMIARQANLAEEIVTIKVGTGGQQTTFQWLKPMLELHSPFFIGAFERSFKEAEKREIELPEDDADVFAEFLD